MKITLRIENYDSLPDGGPLEFSVVSQGFEVGRGSEMDWTLPDSNRRISSRHFGILYRDQQFWLNDLSANGTYVHGQSLRISSPHILANNDRLQVGHYIIRILIGDTVQPDIGASVISSRDMVGGRMEGAQTTTSPLGGNAPPSLVADPWSMLSNPAPMPSAIPMPNRATTPLAGQYGDSFVESPYQGAATTPPAQPSPAAPSMPAVESFVTRPQPMATPLAPVAPGLPPAMGDASLLLDAICKGAGLPLGSLAQADMQRLGEEIGKCLRITTEELMALLGARAAAKQVVKSSSRTMIGGTNNSPLKFKPNAIEAMQTMFARQTDSYLSSTASFQQGFADIKKHQTAIYAAIQPALARLLEDLAPESIELRASSGLMSSKKANAWEIFVERWDAKTHPYENGMLDVFLAYFSDAYDDAIRKTGG